MTTTESSFSSAEVSTAFNHAADEVLEAIAAPESGVRDAINLVVNAAAYYLEHPQAALAEVIAANYDLGEGADGPLEWSVS